MKLKMLWVLLAYTLNTKSVSAYNTPKYTHDLARENFKLVPYFAKSFVKKYHLNSYNRDELIQEGYIGLIYACRKYDESRNTLISTYSSYWIKSYMGTYIKNLYKSQEPVPLDQDRYIEDSIYIPLIDLDILKEYERDIIIKRYFEKRTLKYIAEIYGVSDNTIMRHSKIAIMKLRGNIERNGI